MRFRHLDHASATAVTDLGPAALGALLERGDLGAWTPLLRAAPRPRPPPPRRPPMAGRPRLQASRAAGTAAGWRGNRSVWHTPTRLRIVVPAGLTGGCHAPGAGKPQGSL